MRAAFGIAPLLSLLLVAGSGATVAHSSYTLLIDRSGNLRALMPYGRGADEYAHDLKILLKE